MTSPALERMAEKAKAATAPHVVTIDLVRLVREVLGQVAGSDNFAILDGFLVRNGAGFYGDTGEWAGRPQIVTVDLTRCMAGRMGKLEDAR